MRQIVINLLGNAIKFTEAGEVRMTVRVLTAPGMEPQFQVDVSDTSIGITEEHLRRLFQPFVQADSSTTRRFSGTGLGLTISKRLAVMLSGDLSVDSAPGKGSTFRLTLATGPLAGVRLVDHSQPTMVHQLPPTPGVTIPSDCRILLVEDGPDNQLKKGERHLTTVVCRKFFAFRCGASPLFQGAARFLRVVLRALPRQCSMARRHPHCAAPRRSRPATPGGRA